MSKIREFYTGHADKKVLKEPSIVWSSLFYAYHCNVTKRETSYTSLLWALFFLFSGCATIVTPSGGDKDITPPKIIHRSFSDSTLGYKGGKWTIDFDEFIKLQDVNKEMNITPLVKQNPMLSVHKRRLTINMPDSLLEANTTYRIDLGQSVRDLREGNPYKDLHWTFSTGLYFDSLRLYGNCIDAQTGQADTGMYIFLYPAETPDSMLWVNKPMYVSKNTSSGFEVKNLPNRLFKLVALADENHNFRRDAASDKIAFMSNAVNPVRDTARIQLLSFSESTAPASKSKLGLGNRFEQKKASSLSYSVNVDTTNTQQRSFNLFDTLKITFNREPKTINPAAIRLYADSVLEAEAKLRSTNDSLVYYIQFDWQENTLYRLKIMNDFVVDSATKLMAREYRFRTKQASDFGLIRVRYTPQPSHRLQLVLADNVIATQSGKDSQLVFNHLLPGQYTLRRHIDANNNGVWDTGSWAERRQPERVERINENIMLKSNWENTVDLREPNR